jgi:hypothetical protein
MLSRRGKYVGCGPRDDITRMVFIHDSPQTTHLPPSLAEQNQVETLPSVKESLETLMTMEIIP